MSHKTEKGKKETRITVETRRNYLDEEKSRMNPLLAYSERVTV